MKFIRSVVVVVIDIKKKTTMASPQLATEETPTEQLEAFNMEDEDIVEVCKHR